VGIQPKAVKALPENKGVLLQEPDYYGAQRFSAEAAARFPEFSTELLSDSCLLHVQMGTLASLAHAAIASSDTSLLHRIFDFIEEVLRRPRLHPEVENAVEISFLTRSDFDQSDAGRRAWTLLPQRLQHLLRRAA
jgi:hypothetical protein